MYQPVDYQFDTITLNIDQVISDIAPIEVGGIRRFFAKIPILNRILAIPLDLTSAMIPPLPFNEYLELTEDKMAVWADKDFLKVVKSLKLKKGWLREKTDEEIIAEGHEPGEKTSLFCRTKGLKFISTMSVILEYKDSRFGDNQKHEIPIAYTNNSKKYFDKKKKLMTFDIYDQELRPFIENLNDFRLKLKASGGLPCMRTFLEAGFQAQVVLEIPNDPKKRAELGIF